MSRLHARLALALCIGSAAAATTATATADDAPAVRVPARVTAERLEYEDAPEQQGFVAGTLAQNERLTVIGRTRGGWLAIEPPPGAFCWIDETAIRNVDADPNHAIVIAPETALRTGRAAARMPGPPRARLTAGDLVETIDRPPLRIGAGPSARSWRAVAPPSGLRYYVPPQGVQILGTTPTPADDDDTNEGSVPAATAIASQARVATTAAEKSVAPAPKRKRGPRPDATARSSALSLSVAPDLTSVGPPVSPGQLLDDLATRLRDVETEHRAALRRPMVHWELSLVRSRYQSLLNTATTSEGQAAVRGRIAHVARQQAAATAARRLEEVLGRVQVPDIKTIRDDAAGSSPSRSTAETLGAFEAQGLLQPSSRLVRGQKVYALIGHEGYAAAYLLVPPGLPAEQWLGRQVGVWGSSQYDEALRARVVNVTEMEALSRAP